MIFTELDQHQYDAFVRQHPCRNFLNAASAFEMKRENGFRIAYVGVKDEDQIIAATGIAFVPFKRIFTYAYCQRGYLLDYDNKELLAFFHAKLVEYCKKKHVAYITCDPYLTYRERDINGTIVEGGYCRDHVMQTMKELGYLHQGFTTGFDSDTQVRWSFVLDLSAQNEESLLKQMDHQTRWCVNKTIKQGIKVKALTIEELPLLMKLLDYAADTRSFQKLPLSYYEQRMRRLQEDAFAMVAYLDVQDYIERMEKQLHEEEAALEKIEAVLAENENSKKYQKKRNVQMEAIATAQRRKKEALALQETHGDEILLAGAFFLRFEDALIYVSAGAYDEFKAYNGPYAIHWHMLQFALKNNIKRYDFYGISGDFSDTAVDHGVFEFKKGFGGVVEEYIGVFDYPIKKSLYHLVKR